MILFLSVIGAGRGNDVSLIDISQLKPELNDTDGVFQLGPVDRCKDIYVMSVTVAFASNLTSVSLILLFEACL